VQLLKRLKAYGSISITQGNLLDSLQSPMAHIPPSFGRVGFSYDYRAIFLDAYVLFNGAKPISYYNLGGEDNEQYAPAFGTPAWATCNLKGSFKINQIITAQAGIENILDTNYRTFASGINAPGRNFYFALRCNF
jgi:hemoglobin/transferrin/lactoferrin receptor protein